MRVLGCDVDTLDLQLPECPELGLVSRYSATLSRGHCATQALSFVLVPATPTSPPHIRLTLPPPSLFLRRGVWRLSVNTPCGCYSTAVYLDRCPAPAAPAAHLPTRDTPTPIPVQCSPPLEPDLGAPEPVLGFVFARSSDGSSTGATSSEPVFGSQAVPFPPLTFFEIGADSDALVFEAVLEAPGIDTLLGGRDWQLLDTSGREVSAGLVTSGAVDRVELTGPLLDFLACGLHYLVINPME